MERIKMKTILKMCRRSGQFHSTTWWELQPEIPQIRLIDYSDTALLKCVDKSSLNIGLDWLYALWFKFISSKLNDYSKLLWECPTENGVHLCGLSSCSFVSTTKLSFNSWPQITCLFTHARHNSGIPTMSGGSNR